MEKKFNSEILISYLLTPLSGSTVKKRKKKESKEENRTDTKT